MIASASVIDASCPSPSGQSAPTGDSFSDSPEPKPRKTRPGNISSSVANPCATSAGWYRSSAGVTAVPTGMREVACAAAPSHIHAWPDSPGSHHGWKWSEQVMPSNPARSASWAWRRSSLGRNCSCAQP